MTCALLLLHMHTQIPDLDTLSESLPALAVLRSFAYYTQASTGPLRHHLIM